MQVTLFDLAQQVRNAVDVIDQETGEIIDGYSHSRELFESKALACVAYAKDEAKTLAGAKLMIKAMADKLDARIKRLERFEAYMADCMKATGASKLSSPDGLFTATLYADRDVSVEIDDGAVFPPELCNEPRPPSPSKSLIKAAIERGEPIAGARIVRRDRLTVK